MKTLKSSPNRLALLALLLLGSVNQVLANGWADNNDWQFGSAQDKVNKSAVLDQVMKKQGGYYDAMRPNYNNSYTTYIERQYNCSVTASTSGNTGTNATTATTSSPTVSNAGSTNANTAANSASNGLAPGGLNGVLVAGQTYPTAGSIGNDQANSGSLGTSINGSNTSATTGTVTAGVGTSDQVLNSQQTNSGMLTTSIAGSTACVGPLN